MGRQKNIDARENYSQNKRHDSNSTLGLPEDVLCDTLSRLAANCLCSSARYVCKPCATIIRSSHFVETHLRHTNPGLFVQCTEYPCGACILDIKENEQLEGTVYVANPITMQVARVPDLLRCELPYPPCANARVPRTGEFKLFAAHVQMQSGVSICR